MSEFLAEASVLVLPDTKLFRSTLLTELQAATAGVTTTVGVLPVVNKAAFAAELKSQVAAATAGAATQVPITPVLAGGAGAAAIKAETQATEELAASQRRAGAAITGTNIQRTRATQAQRLAANFDQKFAAIQDTIVGAASRVDAAEIRLTRTKVSLAAATKELSAAQLQAEVGATEDTAATLRQAEAHKIAALEARDHAAGELASARASEKNAAAAAAAGRATVAQAASLTGLRGAALSSGGAFIAAAAGTILFTKALKSVADFQVELATFRVTAGATAEEMAQVGEEARKLGADVTLPGVSAGDAAQAMLELAKAGLSVQDSLAGTRGVLQLATAAGIDNAQATELAASALNSFGLAGDQAVHVADVLANAANDAQGSIVDIGIALQQASAVGRQAGLSLEQVSAVLTLFARNGLKGSDAGTAFRTMMLRLINPTNKASDIIHELGLNLRDTNGAIRLDVFDQFTAATKNLTKAERDRDLAIIFGQDAIRGAAIATREGSDAITQEVASLNKAGTAAEVAAARNAGLAGATNNLKNQLENLGLVIGGVVAGPLTKYLSGLGQMVGLTSSAIQATVGLAEKFADLANKIPGADKLEGPLKRLAETAIFPSGSIALGVNQAVQSLTQLRGDAEKTSGEVAKIFQGAAGKGDLGLNVAINQLDELSKKLAGGDEKAQQLGKSVETVANRLRTAASSGAVFPLASVKIPPELLAGTPGQTIAVKTKEAFAKELSGPEIFSIVARGFHQMTPAIEQEGDNAVSAVQRVAQRIKNAVGQQAGLEETANLLTARGAGPAAQLGNLRQQAAVQQRIIDQAGPNALGDRLKARRAAAAKLAQINTEIKSIEDGIVADQKAAADEAKRKAKEIQDAADAADQAFIDAFAPGQNRIDLAQIRADATERLSDNIAVQKLIASTASSEIAQIDKTVKNVQLRNTEIAKRMVILQAAMTQIDTLTQQVADAVLDSGKFDTRLQAAQDAGAGQAVILKIFDARIAELNTAINKAKAEGRATQELRNALRQVANDRRTAIDDFLSKQTELATLQSERTGNKSIVLNALNNEIANKRKEIAAAKKAHKATLDLRIQFEQLLAARKAILDDAKDAQKGLSAFDLLKEFNAKFNDIAGNLVTADQPFADSSAFSTDIVNKAVASIKAPTSRPTMDAGIAKGADATDRNTRALTELTDAILRSTGNTAASDGKPGKGPSTINRWGAGAWWNAHKFREVRDG